MSKTKSLWLLRRWYIIGGSLILFALSLTVLIHCNHKRSENCLKGSNFGRLILNFGYANVIAMRNMRQEHVVYNYNVCPAQRSPQYSRPQYSGPLDSQRVIMYSKQAHWDQFGREHFQEEHHLTLKIGHSLD